MKHELLKIARKTLEKAFEGEIFEPNKKIKEMYSERKACFVTLIKKGKLRGCIGSLVPRQELWRDVVENSINAAFKDRRFLRLEKSEMKDINIEISILSKPEEIEYHTDKELKEKIKDKGVVLSFGVLSATYLPSVWEEISNPDEFLSSLCLKAGLSADAWKINKMRIEVYNAEKISEH